MHRGRSLLSRPGFWLLLALLALLAFGAKFLLDRKDAQPEPPATATPEPPPPATEERQRPPARRAARPARRTGPSPEDAAIVAVIRNNQTGVRMCYERALKRDQRLSLRLDVRLGVSAAGEVERVAIDGLPEGGTLAGCIRNAIKTWQFPRAAAGYDTAFPLRLQQSL